MNIRVDLTTPITDGTEVVFRSPVDCSQITGLIVYYDGGSKEFAFADAHGKNVGDIDHLFAENVVVKAILDVTYAKAYVQNADTNGYIESTFVKSVNGVTPDKNGNVEVDNGVADLLVQVTQSGTKLVSDKTCAEILSASKSGQDVRCSFSAMILSLVKANESGCIFSGVYNSQVFNIAIAPDDVTANIQPIGGGSADLTGYATEEYVDNAVADAIGMVGGFPTLLPSIQWRGNTNHQTVKEVRFVENYTPASYDEKWDAGVEAGSITAYREGDIITVSANGKRKMMLNETCVSMFAYFSELVTISGLEMLDASNVTKLGGAFAECHKLVSMDLSTWNCGKLTKCGGMFQHCYELRYVKMPNGLNADTLTATTSMFEECYSLVEIDIGNGPNAIGEKMFAKCVNLERVVGLGSVTTIGARAFIYCSKLTDVDINPAIIDSIGESAFRLSGMEDILYMDNLKASCSTDMLATRTNRWNASALADVQSRVIPNILLSVPHADSQDKYTDVKFGRKNKDGTGVVDVSISTAGCSAFSLYHEWQCAYCGTELEKDNFLQYWEAFEGDKFADRNDETMEDYFQQQATILGWTHEEVPITGAEQLDIVIDRLNKRMPTGVVMYSSNTSGSHAVLIVGGDATSRKLAVLDSNIHDEGAVLSWIKFEDIFTSGNDADRLVLHTYGEAYEGYVPPYIQAPSTASVGQTIVVKAVDENNKPTEWEAVDLPSGGGSGGGNTYTHTDTITLVEDVVNFRINLPCTTDKLILWNVVLLIPTHEGNTTDKQNLYVSNASGGVANLVNALPSNSIVLNAVKHGDMVKIAYGYRTDANYEHIVVRYGEGTPNRVSATQNHIEFSTPSGFIFAKGTQIKFWGVYFK